ncbi:hypothetical protein FGIG_05697 [Fasciola gigantica]|uniref:EPS8 spectrin-like domain-containing protein n=1 Tax=Fasciola gigantica TaxID=46835 RepID=A0A504YPL5_FASGI|nr:hypothetical protein FGIG_05697 [Fasciola gigantica]
MVDRDQLDPKVQNVFRIHHIASFVEGEHSLKPEEVVRHLKALHASKRIEETPCIVKLDARGIKIKLEKTKKVNTVVDAYGQHFYMLNRCIDDIESFERRLEKAIKSVPAEGRR